MTKKDLNYWKENAEEDYMGTPISVLKYISELEKYNAPDLLEALQHGLRLAESLQNKESIAVKQFLKNATKAIEKALK